ncbi:MAG: flagellar assembly protein FliH [Sulfuriferula sp.]|nr:flagellar assembly protein FliH [Sulfuriferula sp.]
MIPKEQLTAYQRWEMASFDEVKNHADATPISSNEELTALREQTRHEGYAKGLAEGYQTGHSEGLDTGLTEGRELTRQLTTQLSSIAANFTDQLAQADNLIAADLLDLAMNIAQAMLKTALPIRTELVLPIINEAIRDLPSLQRNAKLILNPGDALLVKEHLQEELSKNGWTIIEDARIEAGGCRIETDANKIDATLGTRWQRLAKALGKEADWLEPRDH